LIEIGENCNESELESYENPGLESVLVNCYTSGTTGMPKGVLLTHLNFLSKICTPNWLDNPSDEVALSFLPMAHVYELYSNMRMLFAGA